jgi:hypothetical protein
MKKCRNEITQFFRVALRSDFGSVRSLCRWCFNKVEKIVMLDKGWTLKNFMDKNLRNKFNDFKNFKFIFKSYFKNI